MAKTLYVKSNLPYSLLNSILFNLRKNKIIFFIDLQSICKGLYNKNNVFNEINYYLQNNEPSDLLINEYRSYLNNLFIQFRQYNPFMITFYDDGHNQQNISISNVYKGGRSKLSDIIEEDEELLLYRRIKKRYYDEIEKRFTIANHGKVYYLREYESDLIPYYIIKNNFFDSGERSTLNVIISNDKDLLQCCQFTNTVQVTNTYTPSAKENKLKIECWDNKNAVGYLYRNFKPGNITANHIPLILALAGDKADKINGISGVGNKKAIDLIENFDIPSDPDELINCKEKLPIIMQKNLDIIVNNIKMISFEEQMKRTKFEEEL